MKNKKYIAFLKWMRYNQCLPSKGFIPKNVPHASENRYKQNSNSISSTAGKLLQSYVLRKVFSYLMDDVLGLGEASEQLIEWLREVVEEN